ncbi:hypothetical protein STAFG_3056 [Streptomyces afghaniensis 772]|uniref:Uncharacterized protein n=1 Tax=Streptomyces afghaniensis 772 TaxID=1283301 RepID=S4N0I3_9ACTN|nr:MULTISPECIES: hypothetical protein [Streptomyces]EPJ39892.1 hypothetical protein STAFG_3056 [Streptomyces afghaniensis 772]UOB15905.1 hypothetical protein MQE23_23825 [Streptomyces sp. HP-A2021]
MYATRVDSPAQAMVLTGIMIAAVLLTIPEVFAGLLRLMPEGGPRRRLVRRQLAADRARACAARPAPPGSTACPAPKCAS